MHQNYKDITSRILTPPKWWDEHAVPRYDDFKPEDVSNIYAIEVALVEIECQNCGTRFLVAFSADDYNHYVEKRPLKKLIKSGELHYGDPPNNDCCPSGPSMNCEEIKVVQYWFRNQRNKYEWHRNESLEVELS